MSNPVLDLVALARHIQTRRTTSCQFIKSEIEEMRARIRALAADGRVRAKNDRDKSSIDGLAMHALTLLRAKTPSVMVLTGATRATATIARTTNPEALAHVLDCWASSLSRLADDIDAEERLALSQPANEPTTESAGVAEEERPPDPPVSLRRVGEVWLLRYPNEEADYPVKGNQFIGWLAELLPRPDYSWTVAELLGDPNGKLKADASLGGERIMGEGGLREISKRLDDIEALMDETGSTEALEDEKAKLLRQVEDRSARRRIGSAVGKAYNNITTQKRQFLKKLKTDMPQLAAHLRACILTSGNDYTISYRPPAGTPRWDIKNPTA